MQIGIERLCTLDQLAGTLNIRYRGHMGQIEQGFETGRDLFEKLGGDLFSFGVQSLTPVGLHQTKATIQTIRADSQNGVPLLNCLSQQIAAHIESRQTSS